MAVQHAGNAINQMTFEEHDGANNAKRVNVVAGGVGQATITPVGLITLAPSPNFIGFVTVGGIGTITLADPKGYIGLTTTTMGIGDRFIGLATVVTSGNITVLTRNAGTNKTLKILPVAISVASITNLVTASNTFYITSVLLNSNATVRLNIKSGATYLTGNASLGVNIFPGGGWVENGAPDSPLYFGLAAGQTITVEKADAGGLISQIGGKIVYFDE